MIEKLTNTYPLRHISIRVPWHDNKWNGTVCKLPAQNSACLKLPRIAEGKVESEESKVAGKLLSEIDQNAWPPCVGERMAFMAPFEYTRHASHPYTRTSAKSHSHFQTTPLRHPAYSASAVPFRWMVRKDMEEFANEYNLTIDPNWEPDLGFTSGWVQDHRNQKALLDCFFGHIVPEKSLCFIYAKQVPFVEDSRRVIIGVGRVKHVGSTTEYNYSGEGELRSVLWEHMIQHSLRPEFIDGFLLPYHEAIELSETNPDFDPATISAFAPDDRWSEFSYGSEHVTNDAALSSLLSCASALKTAAQYIDGPWAKCQKWIDDRLGELWQMRGPCPGLGAALSAFGIELGTFVAGEIDARTNENEDPWPLTDKLLSNPKSVLGDDANRIVDDTIRDTWINLGDERQNLLKLVSRFEISPDQAKQIYVQEERMKSDLTCSDEEILQNPYLIYELTRLSLKPVSIWTVDRGVFPDSSVRDKHPLPQPSHIGTGIDARRIRAMFVNQLESAASYGHTLQSRSQLIIALRNQPIQPPCEVTSDTATTAEKNFEGVIEITNLADGEIAYQLSRLSDMGKVIRSSVTRRLSGRPFAIDEDWRVLLDQRLGKVDDPDKEQELKAREEKAEALRVLAASRFSVLIGPAGTGKTTLLSTLCCQEQIAAGGILLLAPTGKARVRMEQAVKESGISISGLTIAQFLGPSNRYDYQTGQYRLTGEKTSAPAETVIVDEASMLTEEMAGALIEALRGTPRLILIGDHRQLPPIGSGRPFVDIISELTPTNIESIFPRIGAGYAELTIRRRQAGTFREDLQLANWFSGSAISPGEDDVFSSIVASGSTEHVRFVEWNTPDEIGDTLLSVLVEELGLKGLDDITGFDKSLGANIVNGYSYFNCGNASHVEAWQVLSPVRNNSSGVIAMNRMIHKQFRSKMIEFALVRNRRIPKPMGQEQVVYGDKVINLRNHTHRYVYPKQGAEEYIANGEIGIAVGQFKTKKMNKAPWLLKVEFSSQQGYQYDFSAGDFGDEAEPKLELAYALTVHKAQGSEFDLLILVLPSPCRLLSRELLYTALTRQRNRIIILHQGNRGDLKKYSADMYAETAVRLTNLFKAPMPVEIAGRFYEDRLINRTRQGELVRSKSEVIVADGLAYSQINYEYEKPLTINNVTKYPDFTIEDEETGNIFYWEHCGMLQNPEYRERWERKLKWYIDNDIKPADDGGGERGTLIITSDNEAGGISSEDIKSVIDREILRTEN